MIMNQIIQHLTQHRSYRDFDPTYQLPDEDLQAILKAARQAPTWMNGQFYSILVIRDEAIRQQLVAWNPTNPHMEKSSVFLVFLADLARTSEVSKHYDVDYQATDNLDVLLTATTDAALACENAVVAVESLGLGCVVVGSIRRFADKVIDLLQLPAYTYPLFGLSIGKPVVDMYVKPRLPEQAVVHYDKYHPYSYELISEYDKTMAKFGEARETKLWSKKFADYFSNQHPEVTINGLKRQGFIK